MGNVVNYIETIQSRYMDNVGGRNRKSNLNSSVNRNKVMIHRKESTHVPEEKSRNKISQYPLSPSKRRHDTISGMEYRIIYDDFVFDKILGHGFFGIVRKGIRKVDGEAFAVKTVSKQKVKRTEVLEREINVMKGLDHPNIIKLIDVYEDEENIHFVMELCTGGELFDRIISMGRLPEADAAKIIYQVFDAIAYCHKNNVAHRDLKPENFIFESKALDSPIKIIDFGLSCQFKNRNLMKTRVGTPFYLAPEVLSQSFNEKCDLWRSGVILYILLCGYPPFYGSSDFEIFKAIKNGVFSFPDKDWENISMEAKDLIKSLLQQDPNSRPTAEEALKHPWFRKMSFKSNVVST